MKTVQSTVLVGLVSMALGGCSLAPVYTRPNAPLSETWKDEDRATTIPSAHSPLAKDLSWELFVGDVALRKLIGQSLQHNRNLRQVLLNVEAVRAQYRIQRSERVPALDIQGTGSRQRTQTSGRAEVRSAWQAGFGVTAFELDLFGRIRSLSEAALEEYLASEQAARGVKISLITEVVRVYLARDSALQRQRLAKQTLRSREASLLLVSRRHKAGTAMALDYQQALGLTEQAKADLERIDRELRQANNALDLLAGVPNVELPSEPSFEPMLVQNVVAGAPSDLLNGRPDIIAAEHQLRARNADIGAARAAFFPRISLTALLGTSSVELSNLFSSGSRTWSFTPQMSLPLFTGGRNAANLDLSRVRKDAAVAAYEETVQTAFREVSDALAAVDTLRRESVARHALADSSRAALSLSEARWRAGVDDQLRFLDAQRSAFADQTAAIETSTELQFALANLFKALGGGWPALAPRR